MEGCERSVDAFANLDDEISRSVIEQLTDGDKARIEIGTDLDRRIGERERARVALQAARAADEALTRDLAKARSAAADAAAWWTG